MNIAILVCDNGFGHMRRSISIAISLIKLGYKVDIFGEKKGFDKITNPLKIKSSFLVLKECKFSYNLNYFIYGNPERLSVIKSIPNIDNYDLVLSDNIVEVLKIRSDAILIAQFFWHEILPKVSEEYKLKCRNILRKNSPLIFGDKYFSMIHIKSNQNYIPTGLHRLNLLNEDEDKGCKIKKNNLLISGGNTSQAYNLYSKLVQSIIEKPLQGIDMIFVDKNILPHTFPSWIKKASFNMQMYKSLIACICRPGIGTITENIHYGIKIFTLFEKNNLEMIHNDLALQKLSLGESLKSKDCLHKQIYNYINNKEEIDKQILNCKKIDFKGSFEISEKLAIILNSSNSS